MKSLIILLISILSFNLNAQELANSSVVSQNSNPTSQNIKNKVPVLKAYDTISTNNAEVEVKKSILEPNKNEKKLTVSSKKEKTKNESKNSINLKTKKEHKKSKIKISKNTKDN
ncbi:hypothetical protein ATE92_1533 [Ulvibacter sp. MAR_2010_11]|uniref:hypothetical protein n=1 Tax=Ulvibacter sp. MAR_2010_11 TaxID=1250229 RepID=UPI000C2BC328|nr:hypothetical protein [Ulvibacter sp. MAR_2010_11]PKA83381.1 hypothetical protein ATE92_1533 [Ulvibacter sp. MAR_2010_11]